MLILWALNGNAQYHHLENIPDQEENYILVAPHRTWWDPVYMAFATRPKQFIFMAKKNCLQIASSVGGFACVVHFRLTVRIQEHLLLNTPSRC